MKDIRGFTLIELMLVLAVGLIVGVVTFSFGTSYLGAQSLDDTTRELTGTLRQAQAQAVLQRDDSAFGVKVLSDSYVLFTGSSYTGREISKDERHSLSSRVSVSGVNEVVFAKLTGTPDRTGVITLTSEPLQNEITINAYGKVER